MDVGNPAMALDCPQCGLLTARFTQYCRNCGFTLWPNATVVAAAFQAWRAADPERAGAAPYDLTQPDPADRAPVVDYDARAHALGIHVFPSTSWPIVICLGIFLMGVAAVPFNSTVRIVLGAIGLAAFLAGVFGWVLIEDVKMFPSGGSGPGHPGDRA